MKKLLKSTSKNNRRNIKKVIFRIPLVNELTVNSLSSVISNCLVNVITSILSYLCIPKNEAIDYIYIILTVILLLLLNFLISFIDKRSERREKVIKAGEIIMGRKRIGIAACDISKNGACISTDTALNVGQINQPPRSKLRRINARPAITGLKR